MQKLLEGIVNFRSRDFEVHEALFKGLKKSQSPHSLFITCSDSRIDPVMITKALPGDLFIIRNIGNIVPPYRETAEFVSTTSAIEYAILILNVDNIVICGHSNCGGCAACLNDTKYLEQLPHTRKWLELSQTAKNIVLRDMAGMEPEAQEWMMEQVNVVEQMKHLMTYPYVKDKIAKGELQVSGWYYIIETGEIFIYDIDACEFRLANGELGTVPNVDC